MLSFVLDGRVIIQTLLAQLTPLNVANDVLQCGKKHMSKSKPKSVTAFESILSDLLFVHFGSMLGGFEIVFEGNTLPVVSRRLVTRARFTGELSMKGLKMLHKRSTRGSRKESG